MIPKLNENIVLVKLFIAVHLYCMSAPSVHFIWWAFYLQLLHLSKRPMWDIFFVFIGKDVLFFFFWKFLYFIIYFLFIFISFSLQIVFQIYLDFLLFNKCSQNGTSVSYLFPLCMCGIPWSYGSCSRLSRVEFTCLQCILNAVPG